MTDCDKQDSQQCQKQEQVGFSIPDLYQIRRALTSAAAFTLNTGNECGGPLDRNVC